MKCLSYAVLLVVISVPSASILAQLARGSRSQAPCQTTVVANEWTDVKGRGLFIEYPSVALGAGYSLIAGYPAVLYGHAPAQRPLEVHLAVTDVGRRGFVPVLLDGIKRERYWPRAVAAQGVAQVVWGQDTAKSEAQIPHVRELWHASYDGSRWSEPEKIWGPAEFTWDPGTASDLHSTQRGVALAVPAVVNRRSGLLYLERRHGRWDRRNCPRLAGTGPSLPLPPRTSRPLARTATASSRPSLGRRTTSSTSVRFSGCIILDSVRRSLPGFISWREAR
jgi:hypothetical protein